MLRRPLVVLAVLFPFASATAQDEDPAFEVDGQETVVTAGRLADDARKTGRHVSVVTAADIARSSAKSLDELLRFEAGVLVTPRGAFGVQADYSMRGGTFNGVVILVDGARFNDPMTGHFLSDFPIPLGEIARVEVLRGPDAAAWGPDALGGVIHVITHTGARRIDGRRGKGTIDLATGENGTRRADLTGHAISPQAAFSYGFSDIETDGERVLDANSEPITSSDGPVRTDFERDARTLSLGIGLKAARITARHAYDRRTFGAYQFYTPFASDTAREATTTLWYHARATAPDPDALTQWSAAVSHRLHRDTYWFFPSIDPNTHKSQRSGFTADISHRLSPTLTVGGGASAERRSIKSNSLGEHSDVSGGAFALARWSPTTPLTVSASARLDTDPGFGLEATPMLAVAYAATPRVTLRAAGGRAVRAPNYVERYFNTVAPRPGGNLGNPDLVAERAWNAEAGADVSPARGVLLRATGFYRTTTDLIDYVRTTVDGEEVFFAQNVLGADAAGLETSASIIRQLGEDAVLRLSAGYTYTDVRIDPGAFAEGDFKYVLDHSPHLVQGRVALDVNLLRLSVEGLSKTRVAPTEGFTVVHGRIGAVVPRRIDFVGGLEAYIEVRNVFDVQYSEVFGAPMPGRLPLVGIRL
ncbi:MAG: TonB-dependent receptor plug domain-containing protein [Rubricoccaceae bacterium]